MMRRVMFNSVHVMVREKSYRNLLAIAKHPILRLLVNEIYYETATPRRLTDFEKYKRVISASKKDIFNVHKWLEEQPKRPGPTPSALEQMTFMCNMASWALIWDPDLYYTQKELKIGREYD